MKKASCVWFFLMSLSAFSLMARVEYYVKMFNNKYSVVISPVVLPDYYLPDINEVNISSDGKMLFQSNLGGNFRSYLINGTSGSILEDFERDRYSGQYYIRSSISNKWAALDSAIRDNIFYKNGRIDVISKNDQKVVFSVDTKLRGEGEFSWPSVFDFSLDNNKLAYTSDGINITIYDLNNKHQITNIMADKNDYITSLLFHPSGNLIASKSINDGTITLWDIASGKKQTIFKYGDNDISDVSWYSEKTIHFSADGKYIATSSTNIAQWFLWETASGKLINNDTCLFNQIKVSPKNNFIAFGNQIFDQKTGRIKILDQGQNFCDHTYVSFSNDDKFVALGQNGLISLFETNTFKVIALISLLDTYHIGKLVFTEDNNFYALCGCGYLSYITISLAKDF
jgi:WD40 repeat protein